MAVVGVPVITAPGIPVDTSRPLPVRDPLLSGVANSGVRFLFDLAFPWSYPGGSPSGRPAAGPPSAGAVIQDMAEQANGSVSLDLGGAGSIGYAGNGFDFTNSNGNNILNSGVVAPASPLADIFAAYSGASQRFLIVDYIKMPTAANWLNSSGITCFAADKSYSSAASLIDIAFSNGTTPGKIEARRQVSAGTAELFQLSVTADAEDLGTVCQVAAWRNAAGQGLRLRSLTSGKAAKVATKAVGADNTQDFSTAQFCFGRPAAFSATGVQPMFSGVRQYRGWIENLARSGRDPLTVLDADFARQVARNLFS